MYRTLVDIFLYAFKQYHDKAAYTWREKENKTSTITYGETEAIVYELSTALVTMGVKSGDCVGLIADVSHYWTLSNMAIQIACAVDVPRGTDSTGEEIGFILAHSGASIVLVQNDEQVDKIELGIKKYKGKVKKYVVLNDIISKKNAKKAVTLAELRKKGRAIIEKKGKEFKELENRQKRLKSDSLATIIYTSGTTGLPKGVMLTHGNFASQVNLLPGPFNMSSSDRALTLLPPWHIFGRTLEYLFIESGMHVFYTDIKHIGDDMRKIKPTIVPSVPRIWEGVYNKIMAGVKKSGKEKIFNVFKNISLYHYRALKILQGYEKRYEERAIFVDIPLKLFCFFVAGILLPLKVLGYILVFKKVIAATGGALRVTISGGGALPPYVDEFFAAIGINIYEGYGLTETSPVLAVRLPGNAILGTVGTPVPATEIRVISLEGKDVTHKPGEKGVLHVRGPQVMKGYYKNPEKTREVLDKDGWFNTGDLVQLTMDGEISIVGRAKDTIVLTGGENIEPRPIEEKILESPLIDNVIVVGQDKKSIGALIVPNLEELERVVKAKGWPGKSIEEWAQNRDIVKYFHQEVQSLVSSANGFKPFERITNVHILSKSFELGEEMSRKFELKRFVIHEKYKKIIDSMYA